MTTTGRHSKTEGNLHPYRGWRSEGTPRGTTATFGRRGGGARSIDFFFPWRARKLESVNASSPVVVGDTVFITEAYGPGGALLRVRPGGYEVVWKDPPRGKSMACHWSTPIHHDGYLRGRDQLVVLDLASRDVSVSGRLGGELGDIGLFTGGIFKSETLPGRR